MVPMDNNEQLSVEIKYVNQVLSNRLTQAQSEIVSLEALVTQLLEENKELKKSLPREPDAVIAPTS